MNPQASLKEPNFIERDMWVCLGFADHLVSADSAAVRSVWLSSVILAEDINRRPRCAMQIGGIIGTSKYVRTIIDTLVVRCIRIRFQLQKTIPRTFGSL